MAPCRVTKTPSLSYCLKMNPVYTKNMIETVKAEFEALYIEINEQKKQIQELQETVTELSKSLQELTVCIATGLPLYKQ